MWLNQYKTMSYKLTIKNEKCRQLTQYNKKEHATHTPVICKDMLQLVFT